MQEVRYRQRYLDLMMTPGIPNIFYTRAKIINYIRKFLDSRGFLEVGHRVEFTARARSNEM